MLGEQTGRRCWEYEDRCECVEVIDTSWEFDIELERIVLGWSVELAID